ncbi:unnamed protein product [Camellia sinensis]
MGFERIPDSQNSDLCLNLVVEDMNFRTMEEFWPFYMNQHSKPATRRWHFAGTLASILCFIYSLCFNWWFVFFVPLFGYGLAWYSHFFVEKNFPATLSHPFWSLLCDFKMFGLMLTGQLDREIKRLGKRPMLQVLHALEVATKALGKITRLLFSYGGSSSEEEHSSSGNIESTLGEGHWGFLGSYSLPVRERATLSGYAKQEKLKFEIQPEPTVGECLDR